MKPGFIIIVIVGIIFVWAVVKTTGDSISNIFERDGNSPAVSKSSSSNTGSSQTILANTNNSPFSEEITLKRGRATKDDPREEYVEIRADKKNTRAIDITGWKLKSIVSNHALTIGTAAKIPVYPGNNTQNDHVLLEPGDTAYIISSLSPIKLSFRTNKCTGYFEERRDFAPRLSKQCPDPEDEDLEKYGLDNDPPDNSRDEDCLREIKGVSKCSEVGSIDDEVSRKCGDFLDSINYNWCATLHVKDNDFAGDEWYVYVGSKFNDIWDDDDDIIELRDTAGRLVDMIEY